jgi:predicted membrane protein
MSEGNGKIFNRLIVLRSQLLYDGSVTLVPPNLLFQLILSLMRFRPVQQIKYVCHSYKSMFFAIVVSYICNILHPHILDRHGRKGLEGCVHLSCDTRFVAKP